MKYLIVGLGNPGREYENTRHNVGFKSLDALVAKREGVAFKTERLGDVAHIRVKNKLLTLLKPSTYMNLSGKAVAYWMQKEGIELDKVLVVVDDIAIDLGVLRMKTKGSDGGHNGLKDINAVLGTQAYARLRVGVGGDFARGGQIDYVLGEWSEEDNEKIPEVMTDVVSAVENFVLMGAARAMNIANTKKKPLQEEANKSE
ncbi:MAG: aminoacyl-tRNA hydrolase [Rikenellaceae bacterium]